MNIAKFEEILEKNAPSTDLVLNALMAWAGYLKECPKEHLEQVYKEVVTWMVYGLHINCNLGTMEDEVAIVSKDFFHEQMAELFRGCVSEDKPVPVDCTLAKSIIEADKEIYNRFISLMGLMTDLKKSLPPVERHLALVHAQKKWNLISSYFKRYMKAISRHFDESLKKELEDRAWILYCDETEGDVDVSGHWEELSPQTQSIYVLKVC